MTDAWRTSGARYNAARRLRRRAFFSTASLAFFSAATVGLAFVQIVVPEAGNVELPRYLSLLSALLGVFILALSLIEWGARNNERAENLHRNAEALNGFSKRLRIKSEAAGATEAAGLVSPAQSASNELKLSMQDEYDAIKATCFDNHDPIDDEMFLVQFSGADELKVNGEIRRGWLASLRIKASYHLSSIWYFGLCWVVLVVAVWSAPWPADACPGV